MSPCRLRPVSGLVRVSDSVWRSSARSGMWVAETGCHPCWRGLSQRLAGWSGAVAEEIPPAGRCPESGSGARSDGGLCPPWVVLRRAPRRRVQPVSGLWRWPRKSSMQRRTATRVWERSLPCGSVHGSFDGFDTLDLADAVHDGVQTLGILHVEADAPLEDAVVAVDVHLADVDVEVAADHLG